MTINVHGKIIINATNSENIFAKFSTDLVVFRIDEMTKSNIIRKLQYL